MHDPELPRSLRSPTERQRRMGLLGEQHIAPLQAYLALLRAERSDLTIPNFDPLDGGTEARLIFVFEAPGPNTLETGFISRDNDDPSAEATHRFMAKADILRNEAIIWNTGPGWDRDPSWCRLRGAPRTFSTVGRRYERSRWLGRPLLNDTFGFERPLSGAL